ncbi:CO dehydrogenase flavoprotein C-terminal domain-containing protein [Fulvimarina manganoxydans]|uniref:CO dehydrogenase flavoprotein C-terminal domain-containing protein n=1 Tax=Fulvimarina manganoxydans TaxID=937218 RepID=A0A1W1ZCG7_9HYPH|nr:CO dehydrogenase flavoprotein C-terminal domain-containing protein [Fulvimarina manganoxydans]
MKINGGRLDQSFAQTPSGETRPFASDRFEGPRVSEPPGSQCGFCTPGIVMSLYALWMAVPEPTEVEVETALQGNLCRCTGYAPIIRAAVAVSRYGSPAADPIHREREAITARLKALESTDRIVTGPAGNQSILPADLDDFAACLAENWNATIVAGATDVGFWVTKSLRPIAPAIFTGHLAKHFPHLRAYWNRIAGWQVRNMGTIGGNIANGSPIGDTPPVLIALGAEITLRHGATRRAIPLEDFFIAYGRQDRTPGEFVEEIAVSLPSQGQRDAAYKISKRRDEDISSLPAGISGTVANGVISACCIAFGGMAGTPKRPWRQKRR